MIERTISGAGGLAPSQLAAVAARSCSALRDLGPRIQWMHSYVTGDKVYCVYTAPSASLIREHARLVGLPADRIAEVKAVIDPATADAAPPALMHDEEHDIAKEAGVY